MRDYSNMERYLNGFQNDIYPQPEDEGHTRYAQEIVDEWMTKMTSCTSVLDVGCGTGFCQPMFEKFGIAYTGITLGQDFLTATSLGRNVKKMDYSFLDFPDESFDLIFARHSLEHSPMPLLTMKEWYRVSKQWCGVVLPAPELFTFRGINHYSVMNERQAELSFASAGWAAIWKSIAYHKPVSEGNDIPELPFEYRYMLEKIR
jgi:ubiquinone/menaquinone biosynthesis C-methylase UbiE